MLVVVDSMIKTGKEIRELNHHGSINGVRVTRMRFWSCVPLAEQLREIANAMSRNHGLICRCYECNARTKLLALVAEIEGKKDNPPTYCAGCSFKCQASDCDCTCHDRMREYYAKKASEGKKE